MLQMVQYIINKESFKEEKPFEVEKKNIRKLGIQAVPGTTFEINGNNIMVGPRGVFDLDLGDKIIISSLIFNTPPVSGNIIVDMVYEE